MPGRQRRHPNIYNVCVPLPAARHSAGAQYMLAAFIKHLAFSREQCYAPFTDLQKHVQACRQAQEKQQHGRRVRLKSGSKKAIKYYDKLHSLIQLSSSIPFTALAGRPVTVVLGSSVLRPREVYSFTFPPAMDLTGTVCPDEKQLGAASRQMLRTLIMQHSRVKEWDNTPGPTKMFLLFEAPDGDLPAAPDGFVPKRAFNINLRKAFQVNINFDPDRPTSAAVDAMCCDSTNADVELQRLSQQLSQHMMISEPAAVHPPAAVAPPAVWYQCVVHVKGLKPLTSSG